MSFCLKHITKSFSNTTVLNDLSFTFPSKGLFAIKGKSGSGKSTLLNIMSGLLRPDEGKVLLNGSDIFRLKEKQKSYFHSHVISNVFQHYNLFENLSAKENISIAAKIGNLKKEKYKTKLKELSERFGVSKLLNKKVKNLSGGEKQRIAILRALLSEPKVILADEPTGALDETNANEIMKILSEISKNILVIVVSHSNQLITKWADGYAILKGGTLEGAIFKEPDDGQKTIYKKVYGRKWKKTFFVAHFFEDFKLNFLLLISLFCCLTSILVFFGYLNGSSKAVKEIKRENLQYHSAYITEKTFIDIEGSPLKLIKQKRPSYETAFDSFSGVSDYSINEDLSYFVPSYSSFYFDDELQNPCEIYPIFDISLNEFGNGLLVEGKAPEKDDFSRVIVNTEFVNEYGLKVGDILSIDSESDIEKEKVNLHFSFLISGVVKEFSFLNSPRIYYSYLGAKNYLMNFEINQRSLYSYLVDAEPSSEFSCYRYLVFLHREKYIEDFYYKIKEIKERDYFISIDSNTLEVTETFEDLTSSFSMALLVFILIAIIGTGLIVGMTSFSNYLKRKKESAILCVLGAKKRDIEDVYAFEIMLVGILSCVATLSFISPIISWLNKYLSQTFNFQNLLDVSLSSYFGISYAIPGLICFFSLLISYLGTSIPLSILNNISLAEVLRDE